MIMDFNNKFSSSSSSSLSSSKEKIIKLNNDLYEYNFSFSFKNVYNKKTSLDLIRKELEGAFKNLSFFIFQDCTFIPKDDEDDITLEDTEKSINNSYNKTSSKSLRINIDSKNSIDSLLSKEYSRDSPSKIEEIDIISKNLLKMNRNFTKDNITIFYQHKQIIFAKLNQNLLIMNTTKISEGGFGTIFKGKYLSAWYNQVHYAFWTIT